MPRFLRKRRGVARSTIINEDTALPAVGTASLRIFQAATDAGAIDVYVTDPATNIATLTSPTFSFSSTTSLQTSSFLRSRRARTGCASPAPATRADLRLDLPSFVLANQEVASVILTPTVGGTLVNAGVLAQQAAYTAGRNTTARVRLAAAVSANAVVSASAAGTAVATSVVAPTVTGYAVVPSGTPLTITVNGAPVASPVAALAPGGDSTLFVYGAAGSATASLITDDNHLTNSTSTLKMRMVNGPTGAATPLTLNAAFAVIASNVAPGRGVVVCRRRRDHAPAARRLRDVEPDADLQHPDAAKLAGQFGLHLVHAGRCFSPADRRPCARTVEAIGAAPPGVATGLGPSRRVLVARSLVVRYLATKPTRSVSLGKGRRGPCRHTLN